MQTKKQESEKNIHYDTITVENKNQVEEADSKFSEVNDQLNLFFGFITQPIIYKPVIFILMYMATPSYSDPLFYFYTSVLNFTPSTMGRLKLVYGFASVAGIFIFNKFLRSISFKKIIFVTKILSLIFNMLTIVLVERVNLRLGIPDIYFCLATDSLTIALAEINTMPLLVLACNLCPKNIEGTLYAFLMSISNLGSLLSSQFGSYLSSTLGITNNNFNNLSLLVFVANIVLLIPMPALYLVDESKYMISKENEQENKSGNISAENNYNTVQKTIIIEESNNSLLKSHVDIMGV